MRSRRLQLAMGQMALAVGILCLWEYASGRWVSALFISRPSEIFAQLYALLMSGELLYHASSTIVNALSGFFLGGLFGLLVGLLLGRMKLLADLLDPFLMTFYSLPKVALAPLFVLWFGIGGSMKILFVAVIVFFLIFLNTYSGVRQVSREQVTILRLLGARERHIMSKVILPSALAWVFAGLRLSVPYALIGAIVAELIASNRGLGYLLSSASAQFNTGGAFAALTAIMIVSLLLNALVRVTERLVMPWQALEQTRDVTL